MTVTLFVVGGILTACGLFTFFFRATQDAHSDSEVKVGDMRVSSSKPSLFLIAGGVLVLLIAAKMRADERNKEDLERFIDKIQSGL